MATVFGHAWYTFEMSLPMAKLVDESGYLAAWAAPSHRPASPQGATIPESRLRRAGRRSRRGTLTRWSRLSWSPTVLGGRRRPPTDPKGGGGTQRLDGFHGDAQVWPKACRGSAEVGCRRPRFCGGSMATDGVGRPRARVEIQIECLGLDGRDRVAAAMAGRHFRWRGPGRADGGRYRRAPAWVADPAVRVDPRVRATTECV